MLQRSLITYRLYRSYFQRFVFAERRENPWQTAGEERFAGSGWAKEQKVVATASGNN